MLASALLAAAPRALAQQEGVATYSSGSPDNPDDTTVWTITGPTVVTEGTVAEYTIRRTAGDAPLDMRVGTASGTAGLARVFSMQQCDSMDACLVVSADWRSGGSWLEYSPGSPDGHVMRVTVRQDNQVEPDETLRVGFDPSNPSASSDWSFTVTIRNGDRNGTVTINRHTTANAWDLGRGLTATLTDPDGIVPGSVRWQWERNPAPDLSQDWADIAGATSRTYVPGGEDMETGLRARASYDDRDGTGKSAAHPGRPVQGICGRTPAVRDAIRGQIPGSPRCEDVRLSQLAAINPTMSLTNSVNTLRDFDFFGLSGLRGLTIRHFGTGGLPTLPTDALAGLDGLVTLMLSENRLTELDPEWFRDLGMLETLNISRNRLTVLQEGVFDHVPNLGNLALHNNRLSALPRGVFADITGVATLSFYRNPLGSVSADTFDDVDALDTLDLRWANLGSLPEGFFLGHHDLSVVRLHHNPGNTGDSDVPFELTVRLERSDSLPWTAPGPATVSVRIAEGAPGPITATLRASGDLSSQTAVIPAGEEASGPVTLTPSAGETHARVFIDSIRNITSPEVCFSACYGGGIRLAKGNADLALPAVTVPDQTWTAGTPVSLLLPLPVGGDGTLAHAITPALPEGVTLDGREISGTPQTARPAQAHEWTATDSSESVTLTFSVTVDPGVPAPPENLQAIGGIEQVTLEWDAGSDRGATIDLWQHRMSSDNGENWTAWADIPGGGAAGAHTVTALAAGPTRVFEVRARNSVGFGLPAQATASPVSADIAPTFAGATVADQAWIVGTPVSLALPEALGGNPPLVSVLAPALPAGVSVVGRNVSGTPSAVTAGREHTWTFTDANGDAVSLAFRIAVAPGRPGAPTDFRASSGLDRQAGLSWSPGPDNGAPIDRWQFRVSDDNGGSWTDWADIPGGAAARAHTVTGLAPILNIIELRARNSAGFGPAARATATPVELDTVPTFGAASVANQDWTVGTPVSLTLPEPAGGNLPYSHTISPPLPAGVSLSGRIVSGTPLATAAAQTHTLTATDDDGDTVTLTFTVAVAPDVPGAPVNLSATAGTLEVTLGWDAGPDNGAAIDLWEHRVSVSGDTNWSDWAPIPGIDTGTLAHTVTGLAANTEHTFQVRARNSVGLGPATSAAATPLEVDTQPSFGAATVADQDWTVGTAVSLDLPEASGGNGALTYSLDPALPANVTRSGRAVSGTPVAAATGQEYAWTATDADGDAVSLTFTVAVAPDLPGAPENLVATAGTLEVTLGWDAGPDNGGPIDFWQYRVSVSGAAGWSPDWETIPGSGADTDTHTVAGLAANVGHTFQVRAHNSAGFGPAASAAATPLNTPPTFGAETVADQDWTVGTAVSLGLPEASGGNGALTYSLDPGLPADVTRSGRAVSGTPTVAAAGQQYTWTATDGGGDAVSLTFTVAVVPGVPGAPVNLSASAGTLEVTLGWDAGPDNGATINLWQYRVRASGDTNWSDWEDIPGSDADTDTHTVTGLAANIGHTFQVRARNGVGLGPPAGATATPLNTPPTFGAAAIADQDWTAGTAVSLDLPEASGGNGALTYLLNPELPANVTRNGRTVSGTPTVAAAGQEYTWTATDDGGDAVSLTFTIAVEPDLPGAPENLVATAGTLEVTLSWDAGPDNGATIDFWQYRVSVSGGASWSPDWATIPGSDADTDMHTVTGLAANVGRTFQVRAHNSAGFGPAASAAATPLNTPPTFGTVTVADQSWTAGTAVSLDLPEASGGNGALTYLLNPELPANVTRNGRTVSGTPTAASAGQQYTWTATDDGGDAVSLTFTIAVVPDVPAAPVNLSATAGTLEVTLGWDAGPDNGAVIDLWQYRVSVSGGAGWSPDWTTIPGSDADTDTHTVTGLAANTEHTFQVRARNSVGFGPEADATATPLEVDTQPTFGAATVASQDWTVGTAVSLELPEASGGNGALTYSLDPALPANVTRNGRTVSGTPTVAATGQEYTWTATDGDGDAVSLTFPVAVAPDFPGAPENLVATAGTLEVTLDWDAGPDNGATIDLWQYRVSVSGGGGWSPDWTDIPASDADTDTHTVTGLAANTGHTFQVRARNSAGFGPAASAAATPLEVDTQPSFGAATVADQDWTVGTAVSLDLPEASGGNGALTYSLDPELPAGVTRNRRTVSGTPTATVTGQGHTWTATDADGDAVSLTFTVAVAPDVPGAPANLSATAGTLEVTLDWSAGPDNGATIDSWQYRVSVSGDTGWSDWADIPASDADTDTHTVTGLAANVGHTLQVRARNSVGFGPAADATATPLVLDTEPTFGAAAVADQDWTAGTDVSLELPEASGGNGPLTYSLNPELPANVTRNGRIVSGTPAAVVTGQEYTWTATDDDGDPVSLTFTVVVTPGVPGAPVNLSATAGNLEVTLDWDTGPSNGATIESWQYRVSVSGTEGWSPDWETIPESDADTDTHTVTRLATNVGHAFQVRARNSVGLGPAAGVTATPTVDLRLLPRPSDNPDEPPHDQDALLLFYFTSFNRVLANSTPLSRIVVRSLARNVSVTEARADEIARVATTLGGESGVLNSHPANLYADDDFTRADALLLFYSLRFGTLLVASSNLAQIVVKSLEPYDTGLTPEQSVQIIRAGMALGAPP